MFNSFCCSGLISKGLLKKNANDAKKICKNACNMKNKMYICIGKQVEIEPTDTYFKPIKRCSGPKSISPGLPKQ